MRYLHPLLLIAGVLLANDAWPRTLQQVLNEGTLRVGVALSSPWTMRADNGELSGFEIDVANRLAEDMRLRADIHVYPWDRLIPALESGEIDVIASGLAITPDRALHVNFSAPYAQGGISVAAHTAHSADVERFEDFDTDRFRVAAVGGTTAAALVSRLLPRATLVPFDDIESAAAALVDGDVDLYFEELPVPAFLALQHPTRIDVPIATPLLTTPTGFAINRGDADFLAFLNAWIVARGADTWLSSTYAYWFESLHWQRQQGGRGRR